MIKALSLKPTLRRSAARGRANLGWLDSHHTFSFADYYDPEHMHFRSLRVINEDVIAPARGFGTHPHRDMEIITYVLGGSLKHADSMGNGRIIRPGDFQYMSAGSGVTHSEVNPSKTDRVHFLQIWMMPDVRNADPVYAEKAMGLAEPGRLHLITSKGGRDGSIRIRQDADLYLARFHGGESISHVVKAGRGAWIQVAEGEVTVNGTTLRQGDAASYDSDGGTALEMSSQSEAQVLLFDVG